MAAYGLYTHIQSNRIRSVFLLIGLFFLVFVLTYAGALTAEAFMRDAPLDWYLQQAWRDTVTAVAVCRNRHGCVAFRRVRLPSEHDRRHHRRP